MGETNQVINQASQRRHASGVTLILYRYLFATAVEVFVTRPFVIFEARDAVVYLKLSNVFS